MRLITLVYVSFATHALRDAELLEILNKSWENNARNQVTGMLLYRARFFVQVLEGDEEAIENTFINILADRRHNHVFTVYTNDIQTRMFPTWTMGFNKLDETLQNPPDGYTDFLNNSNLNYLTSQPSRALQLLFSFRESVYC